MRLGLAGVDAGGAHAPSSGQSIAKKIITVAGTNGKGSTIAALQSILAAHGLRCGVFTSPHFQRFNERFQIAGEEVSDSIVCSALEDVEQARGDTSLSYFEFSTLIALKVFADAELDVAILEVGLGGRLDASNIVAADIAIITRIDLDHQDWLGDTREAIGGEKAGILRRGIQFVCTDRDVPQSICARAVELGAASNYIGADFDIHKVAAGLQARVGDAHYGLPNPGVHPDSIAGAVSAAELVLCSVEEPLLAQALRVLPIRGRNEVREIQGRSIRFDVAHNPASVAYLCSVLQASQPLGRRVAVFAVMADKDWSMMIDSVSPFVDDWFLASLVGNDRAESAERIGKSLANKGLIPASAKLPVYPSVAAALSAAIADTRSGDEVLVFGSFFTLAAAYDALDQQA